MTLPDSASLVCASAATSITAWCSLLPPDKRKIVRGDGTVDELLFEGNMLIHSYVSPLPVRLPSRLKAKLDSYIVDVHHEPTTLAYSPVESACRCASPVPTDGYCMTESIGAHVHTSKVLLTIEKLYGLLTLPTSLTTHTPFSICMIANTAIAHLSACRHLYQWNERRSDCPWVSSKH